MEKSILYLLIAVLLFTSLLSGNAVQALNNEIGDIPSSWAVSYIDQVMGISALGIDKLDSNYQKNIMRGEFAYLSVKLYEYLAGYKILDGIKFFKDTDDPWVLKAKRAGLITGYNDKTFRPNDNIRRDEIAAIFVNVFTAADTVYKNTSTEPFADDGKIANWAKKSVYIAKANGIIGGVGGNNFDSSGFATREQTLVMLAKALSSVTPNIIRIPKLGVDKIMLREVETTKQNITLSTGPAVINVDKADYPFEPDDSILGQWTSADLVSDPLLFNPAYQQFSELNLQSVTFRENGIVEKVSKNGTRQDTWTKGLIMTNYLHEHLSSRCFLATVDGNVYLFYEWKTGDYIYRNSTSFMYYVFTKK